MLVSSHSFSGLQAQQQATDRSIGTLDVAAIRASKDSEKLFMQYSDGGFTAKGATLLQLLAVAYSLREDLIFNLPEWAKTTRWDVNAKIDDPDVDAIKRLPWPDRRAMLEPVLAERFGVRVHRGSKAMPIFELVIAAGGPKLQISETQTGTSDSQYKGLNVGGVRFNDKGEITTFSTTVSVFATQLSRVLKKTVLDHTGLTKRYDINLRWEPDEMKGLAQDTGLLDTTQAPGLFTAIQEQLGMKLLPSKGPVEVLVVDQASLPTAN